MRLMRDVTARKVAEQSRGHDLEALVSITERLDGQIERHTEGWTRPYTDEADVVGCHHGEIAPTDGLGSQAER